VIQRSGGQPDALKTVPGCRRIGSADDGPPHYKAISTRRATTEHFERIGGRRDNTWDRNLIKLPVTWSFKAVNARVLLSIADGPDDPFRLLRMSGACWHIAI
jgi:hypothetical protein